MAHYAFIDNDGIVIQVIPGVDETETIEGLKPEAWYFAFTGNDCRRTSYNTHGGQHANGGTPYRKNYAGVGHRYDPIRDAFIPPQPYPSWLLDQQTCLWQPPTPYPDDDGQYVWDEEQQQWNEA